MRGTLGFDKKGSRVLFRVSSLDAITKQSAPAQRPATRCTGGRQASQQTQKPQQQQQKQQQRNSNSNSYAPIPKTRHCKYVPAARKVRQVCAVIHMGLLSRSRICMFQYERWATPSLLFVPRTSAFREALRSTTDRPLPP